MPNPILRGSQLVEKELSVLVVDDDPGMVTTLQDILSASGYAVEVAHSGTEALERVSERQPDWILLDIRMPGMNGVEAYRELERRSPDSSVIFMTAFANSDLVRQARGTGAVLVLPKPIDLERLIDRLAQGPASDSHPARPPR